MRSAKNYDWIPQSSIKNNEQFWIQVWGQTQSQEFKEIDRFIKLDFQAIPQWSRITAGELCICIICVATSIQKKATSN